MYLFIVRHGEPDYENDCLTEKGKREAFLTAERLMIDRIDEIHASPLGRAQETASYLAEKAGLPILTEPWASELDHTTQSAMFTGEPIGIGIFPSTYLEAPEHRKMTTEEALAKLPGLCDTGFPRKYRELCSGLDDLLFRCGYQRTPEGFYFPLAPSGKHIALYCHGAMIRSLLGHLFNIPYPFLGSSFHENHCGVTILRFDSDTGSSFVPKLLAFGDIGHLYQDGNCPCFYLDGDPF